MNLKESLSETFPEGSHEYEVLTEVDETIRSSSAVTASEAKTHLILLDHLKISLSSMYFTISKLILKKKNSIQSDYDSQYTLLVKRGRPSKDAIEAEIRVSNPQYTVVANEISDLESVKELITLYLKCIDSSRQTSIELLRNLDRID